MSKSQLFNISLSSKGLRNIPCQESRNDFDFIVGDNHYHCPWFVAAFLSQRICENLSFDGSQQEFHVETPDPNHQFCDILSLSRGETICFTSSNLSFFVSIAREFNNFELLYSIESQIDSETDLNVETVIDRLLARCKVDFSVDSEIEFLAKHFYEFSLSSLSKVKLKELESIFSHPSLQIESEDFLYEIVISRMNENPTFLSLFEYVRFEYVSTSTLSNFAGIICEHFEMLNCSILSAIFVRFLQDISPPPRKLNSRLIETSIEFLPNPSTPLEGIISYLTRKRNGNVHDRGIVTITSHEPYNENTWNAAKNAADLTADSYFYSKNAPNQWICYDFGDCQIKLTHYSIRSRHNGNTNDYHPKSWVIEISKDCSVWEEIDRRENDSSLNGRNLTHLFKVSRPTECRLIRLRQIGKNHYSSPDDRLVISGFEIFGELMKV
jgi:hypothetical protein